MCKCDEDTHWSIQKANDTNYINSFTNEQLCYLGQKFNVCSVKIYTSNEPYNIFHYMCHKKNKITTKTYEEMYNYNKQFQNEDADGNITIDKQNNKKIYKDIWYIIDVRYILQNLQNNNKIIKDFNINYDNSSSNEYIITTNPNDLLARLFTDYKIKNTDRKETLYLSYNNNKPILINYNSIDFYNYNSLKKIVWTFTDLNINTPVSIDLEKWNKTWIFEKSNIINTIEINMNMSNGKYNGSVYCKEKDNSTISCHTYNIVSYDTINYTIYANNQTILLGDETSTSIDTSTCPIKSIDDEQEDSSDNNTSVLIISMSSCSNAPQTRIKAWKINETKQVISLCSDSVENDICDNTLYNYCTEV